MVDMHRTDEKGMALILVMIMVAVLSVIAASLMAVSTADTASSTNYRLMTLARYGAETAVHRAANYLMSNAYTAAGPSTGTDPLTNYDMTGTPDPVTNLSVVTYGGAPVRLSHSATTFNYPGGFGGSVGTAFRAGSTGTLAGTYAVTYRAVATLVSMRQISVFGGGSAIVQTWKITGEGLMPVTGAAVDVSAILERQVAPVFAYAAFATDPGCAALDWQGNAYTDSYNSAVGHTPDIPLFGGNVGTNGNLTLTGSAEINGTLSTPRSRGRLVRSRERADRVTHEGRRHGLSCLSRSHTRRRRRPPTCRPRRSRTPGPRSSTRGLPPTATSALAPASRACSNFREAGPAIRPPSTISTASP